jgi:hypothetical protein
MCMSICLLWHPTVMHTWYWFTRKRSLELFCFLEAALNNFKITRQLPICNMTAELALFPFAGRGIVFYECVAKQVAGNFAPKY